MQHHANLLVGSDIHAFSVLAPYLTPGPDVHHSISDTLTIDDVRAITMKAVQRPVASDEVIFVIVARSINHEAQHALLKLLEEPPSFVRFYLVVPSPGHLLATVRSRLIEADSVKQEEKKSGSEAVFKDFTAFTYGERLDEIAKRTKAKDTAWADAIFAGAEACGERLLTQDSRLARANSLVSRYRAFRGSSQKMLLEELALTLPQS